MIFFTDLQSKKTNNKTNNKTVLALLKNLKQLNLMDSLHAPRPEKIRVSFRSLFLLLLTVLALGACKKKDGWIEVDPAFSRYIDAYTTGTISKTSPIRIRLAGNVKTVHAAGEEVDKNLFKISPSVKGKSVWTDASTIEFKPEEWLKPNTVYEVNFNLGKTAEVPKKFEKFRFNLRTVEPALMVSNYGLRASGTKNKMNLTGQLETSDIEDSKTIEKLLKATQNGKELKISWQHNDAAKTHNYTIENVDRLAKESELHLSWDGSPLNMKQKDALDIPVPAAGDFKVLDVLAVNESQQYASVLFSDNIEVGQDLTGLLNISGQPDLSYTVNGSEVKVFTGGKLNGNFTVNINSGIKNTFGDILDKGFTSNINFANMLPSVGIFGKGNILPNSGRLVLPFEAVNLKAVDVSIIKIYETNVPLFLQQNDISGESELRRVARPVVQATVRLDDDKTLDLRKHQRFSLDIDKYLKTEPGALYRVIIGFRPEYSLFSAVDTSSTQDDENDGFYPDEGYYSYASGELDDDGNFWNRYDTYYPYGYNWERRDDPSSKSYYNKDRWATRNILASNLGLTAKRDNYNGLNVAVTNILDTKPESGVDISVLDYQLTEVGRGNSNNDGLASLELKRKPFLLIARKGNERGYLKLDDGSSLPLSRFDVGGEEVKNGIKGFIFGERGVWRPGDTMYLNFIVEDKAGKLPADHPVEFSLFTPQGQLYTQSVQSNAPDGFYLFKTNTTQDAPTGNWLAKIKVGGAAFEKRIKIETVMPNRLKINFDFGRGSLIGVGSNNQGLLNSKWLFGTPGKNLKAKVDVTLTPSKKGFSKWPGYTFFDPTSDFTNQMTTLFDGRLDEQGNATIKPDLKIDGQAPGMLNANMLTKVFEPGGNFSIDNFTIPYSPFASYAGIKLPEGEKPFNYLLAGKTHTAQLVNTDNKGNLIGGERELEVKFFRIQWRWWWDEYGDNLSNFTQDEYNKLIKRDVVTAKNGKASWDFGTGENEWGRYLILVKDLKSGHTTGQAFYIDDYGWQSRSGDDNQSAASMLSFTSDKTKYNVGDEVALTIPSTEGGRLLVSLESGSRVIQTIWKETQQGQTIVKFKADKSMAPNIYATVSLLQPHNQTINDLPIRMYGAIPLMVENPASVLKPVLTIPPVIRPEQNISFSVSEQNGKPMTYSVAIVDDGLLDLTRFKTPDPHGAFYGREALGVKTFDMFDYVIGAWGGGLERILTIGGDEDAGPVKQKAANRFPPVVKYLGPFQLGKGGKQTHNFTLPSYMGSVRAMVVAAKDGSYGSTEKTITVKKPLMMLATIPRVLGPGEHIKLPVTVFATENNIKNVTVSLQPNAFIEPAGATSQTVSFDKPGEQMAYFDVRVKPATGIAKVKLLANAGGENAAYEVEIDVRNPNPAITSTQQLTLGPGQTWTGNLAAIGDISSSSAVAEISSVPNMQLEKRLQYLIDYPHGCIEQTTSKVFPQLVLNQFTDLDKNQQAMIDRNIRAGINKILNMQRPDGGFGYWPGATTSDDWSSSYAGHFLVEAKASGYAISDYAIQQWINYQRGKANSWAPSSINFYGGDLAQSYRLFTLAKAKAAELGAMNRLKEFAYLSTEAKWRLAAAYKMIGQDAIALKLISGLPTEFEQRMNPGITFGSDLRDQAMVLETLTLLGRKDKASELVRQISAKLAQEQWYSTQTTAYALLAIANYGGKNASGNKIIANIKTNGKSSDINIAKYISTQPIDLAKGTANVSITNKGSNTLYVNLVNKGRPLAGDTLQHVANNSHLLQMTVSYINQDGSPINVSNLAQGTDFIAKVVVTNTGNRGTYRNIALSQIFPSGWEILNPRMTGTEGAFNSSPSDYQDVRDDRVYTYFDLRENATHTYYVQLNATYPGRYFLPGSFAQAMYDNTISAGNNGQWIEVVQ